MSTKVKLEKTAEKGELVPSPSSGNRSKVTGGRKTGKVKTEMEEQIKRLNEKLAVKEHEARFHKLQCLRASEKHGMEVQRMKDRFEKQLKYKEDKIAAIELDRDRLIFNVMEGMKLSDMNEMLVTLCTENTNRAIQHFHNLRESMDKPSDSS